MKWLSRLSSAIAALSLLIGLAGPVLGGPITLSIPGREDYVFDNSGILYITDGSNIDRYNTQTNSFLTPFQVGGNLLGIDISPDGRTLAVADTTRTGIDLVSTSTGAVTPVNFTPSFGEGGAFTVAYGSDGNLLVTTQFLGSGFVPLRLYDPATGMTTIINPSIGQATMLTASADRSTIGLAEGNQTGGPISAYSVAAGAIVATTSLPNGLFTYEIATNHNGTQFVVPTYYGAYVYDRSGSSLNVATVLGVNGNEPITAVYSPNSHYLFVANWDFTGVNSGVQVYDTNTWMKVASLDNYQFGWTGNNAFTDGRMRISPNGNWLAVSVDGGTELFNVSAFSSVVPEPNSLVLGLIGVASAGLIYRLRKGRVKPVGPMVS
jgi:hypothetical protein